nr:hypothetical protein CTI12_AA332270 [Tanacetum cinerariifolium]
MSFMVIISSFVSKLVEGRNHAVKPATLVFAAATEDSRSTDNLISANLVERLGIKVTDTVPFRTTLGNGETVYNQGICKGVIISFPELQVVEDFNIFNMGNERHYNVILGIKCLKTLGDVMVNSKLLTMTFGSDTAAEESVAASEICCPSVENTAAAPKKLLPRLLNILCY